MVLQVKIFVAPLIVAWEIIGAEGIERYIKTIGLFRSKAKHAAETCRLLIERHGAEVPEDRDALQAAAFDSLGSLPRARLDALRKAAAEELVAERAEASLRRSSYSVSAPA